MAWKILIQFELLLLCIQDYLRDNIRATLLKQIYTILHIHKLKYKLKLNIYWRSILALFTILRETYVYFTYISASVLGSNISYSPWSMAVNKIIIYILQINNAIKYTHDTAHECLHYTVLTPWRVNFIVR